MEAASTMDGLEVRDLTVTFPAGGGTIRPADKVSFRLAPGRTLGLVGESGSGKTVTALSIMGLTPPPGRIAGGQVLFAGKDLLSLPEREMADIRGRRIAMIFQEPATALNPVITVGAQIAEAVAIHHGSADAWAEAVHMLDRVGIPEAAARARTYPHQMSGGMRQRVMIAMALICRPDVLIADEPTTALDVTIQAQIVDLMLDMQRRRGLAILFISHDLGVVSDIADDIAVMYAGRLVEIAPAGDLFERPLHPYTQGLIETLPGRGPRRDRLASLPGAVPDLGELPGGCNFSDRCPLADGRCREAAPPLEGNGRLVACWKAEP
jgi:peptide/nickel transport system ATP-binding protein/oligopeptide transport system ATP-binding protein